MHKVSGRTCYPNCLERRNDFEIDDVLLVAREHIGTTPEEQSHSTISSSTTESVSAMDMDMVPYPQTHLPDTSPNLQVEATESASGPDSASAMHQNSNGAVTPRVSNAVKCVPNFAVKTVAVVTDASSSLFPSQILLDDSVAKATGMPTQDDTRQKSQSVDALQGYRHGRSQSEPPPTCADVAELVRRKQSLGITTGPNFRDPSRQFTAVNTTAATSGLHGSATGMTTADPPSAEANASSPSSQPAKKAATTRMGRPPHMRSVSLQYSSDKRFQNKRTSRRGERADNSLNLLMNVRVLLEILEREDPKLKLQAVQAMQYCSKRHKAGDPDFKVLSKSIDKMLKMIVGERRWKLAEDCQRRLAENQVVPKEAEGETKRPPSAASRRCSTSGRKSPRQPIAHPGGGPSAAV